MKITLISIVKLAVFCAAANSRSIEEARELFRSARGNFCTTYSYDNYVIYKMLIKIWSIYVCAFVLRVFVCVCACERG